MALPKNAAAAWWWPFGYKGIKYEIKIEGLDEDTLRWIKTLKLTERNEENPPKDEEELTQESVALGAKIKKALDAHGFYDAVIQQKVINENNKNEIDFNINPGTRYSISEIAVIWPENETPVKQVNLSKLKTHIGDGIDTVMIHEDAIRILNHINKNTCLLSLDVSPLLKLYSGRHEAKLEFTVTHGPVANFGNTEINGNKKVYDPAIKRSITWKQGECFDKKKIEQTQNNLIQNGLFASVKVSPENNVNNKGEVPIDVVVKERVPRTIKAGASYSTDVGAGVTFGWENRNYFNNGEKLDIDGKLAEQEQSLTSTMRVPGFIRSDQTLVLNGSIVSENTDAYLSDSIKSSLAFERRLYPTLNSGLGVGYEIQKTQDALAGTSRYALLSFPGFMEYDSRDNALDAKKGIFARVNLTPYTETFGDGGRFFKTQGIGQTYLTADALTLKPTLALKLAVGTITGQTGDKIPSDVRFYEGGSGSVRGYSYQSLGPRLNGQPIGGSSSIEASSEIRMRFTEKFGGVIFADAGNAYAEEIPQYDQKLYYGAGIGFRYFSPVGPLRFDIAFPINGSDINQTGYQFYVSIGQDF